VVGVGSTATASITPADLRCEHLADPLAIDGTWKTHPSLNVLLGTWTFMDFGGECYDAGKELPNWCSPDLDHSNWKPAATSVLCLGYRYCCHLNTSRRHT
jgi:alpha-L-rhamnosidase